MRTEKDRELTKGEMLRSVFLFVLHGVILLAIVAVLLFGDKLGSIGETFAQNAANYLYMLFCIVLVVGILYFYFLFENRSVLASGKNITLIFTALDTYLIMAVLIGNYFHVYARPVALVPLLIYALIGRREAIFTNIICGFLTFIVDNFSTAGVTANNIYSSMLISFSAGMVAIFFFEKAKTRFQIVKIGVGIVVPIDVIVFLLELSMLLSSNSQAVTELSEWSVVWESMGFGFFGGVGSTVLFLALLPVFEAVFNCLTNFRVRELTGHDAKLLDRKSVV